MPGFGVMPRSKSVHSGFSLFEIVLVVGLLSVGLLALIKTMAHAARAVALSSDLTEAVFLAKDMMQEIQTDETSHLYGRQALLREGAKGKFSWRVEIAPPAANTSALGTVALNIRWLRYQKEEHLDFQSYVICDRRS